MTNTDENAIQQDALEQSDAAVDTEQQPNHRMDAMESIVESRRKALEAEGVAIEREADPAHQETEPEEEAPDEQIAAQLGDDERAVADTAMRVKVKVDGEEIELPLSEVVKSYQKDAAATRRLQEANRILEAVKAQEQQLAQPGNNQMQDAGESSKDRLALVKEALSKLYEGDEEGAANGLLQLMDKGASATQAVPQVDPASLVVAVKQQLAVDSAYEQAQSDYPELFADTERGVVLGRETYQRMQMKVQTGISQAQALRQSVEEVASLFGVQKAGRQSSEPTSTARDEKLARKAKLDKPGTANVVAGSTSSPNEAPNVSATIAEMAKGRLGQSMNMR